MTDLIEKKGINLKLMLNSAIENLPKVSIDPEYALAVAIISGGFIIGPLCIGAIAVSEWIK